MDLDEIARVVVVHAPSDEEAGRAITAQMRAVAYDTGMFTIDRSVVDTVQRDDPDLVLLVRSGDSAYVPRLCAELHDVLECRIIVVDFFPGSAGELSAVDGARLVEALDAGADDYMLGHDPPAVLHARVRAGLRARPARRRRAPRIELGDVIVDVQAHALFIGGNQVSCPLLQFNLLIALATHPNEMLTRESLIASAWGLAPEAVESKRVRTAISVLRRILGVGPHRPRVETASGLGYRLVVALPD